MQKKIRCHVVLFWEVTCLDNRPSIIFIGWNLVINFLLKGVLHMALPKGLFGLGFAYLESKQFLSSSENSRVAVEEPVFPRHLQIGTKHLGNGVVED